MPDLPAQQSKNITIKEYLSAPAVQQKMKEMLISDKMVRQFTTSVISLSSADELLANAEPRSLFTAALTAASLDLPINKNLGFAHIIGYKNNKKGITEAQFQIGAKGLKQLAMRTGQYKHINESDVREGEIKSRNRLSGEIEFAWIEDEAKRLKAPIIGYVSYFELHNGFESTIYMTTEEVKAHAQRYSQAYKKGYGPWADNFPAMAAKTVMKKNIGSNGPMSTELQTAVTLDQAVISEDGEAEYIDGTGEVISSLPQDTIDAIGTAESVDEIKVLTEDLSTEQRRLASPYINKRMKELADAQDAETADK
jgi:recombination protein RecT